MSDDDIHAAFLDEIAEAPDTERTPTVADGCDCGDADCDVCDGGDDYGGILHDGYDSDLE
jgi:hypothetical protein